MVKLERGRTIKYQRSDVFVLVERVVKQQAPLDVGEVNSESILPEDMEAGTWCASVCGLFFNAHRGPGKHGATIRTGRR